MKRALQSIISNTGLVLALIFVAGLLLRLNNLDAAAFWRDEVQSLNVAHLGFDAIFGYRFGWIGNQTPLYYLAVWLTTLPIDPHTTTWLARLPAMLAGALAPLAIYGVGKELFGRATGLLAAVFMMLSTISLNYSHDLRPYTMLTLLAPLSVYALLRAESTNSGRWWAAFAAVTSFTLLYAFIGMTMILPAIMPYLAWLLWRAWRGRKERPNFLRNYILAMCAIGAVAGITALMILGGTRNTPSGVTAGSLITLSNIAEWLPEYFIYMVNWFIYLPQWYSHFGFTERQETIVSLAILVMTLGAAYVTARRGQAKGVAICGLFLLISPVVFTASYASLVAVPIQRYAIFAMPFYFLLVGNAIVVQLRMTGNLAPSLRRTAGGLAAIMAAACIGLFAFGAIKFLTPQGYKEMTYRPDHRSMAAYLSQQARPDDLIVFVGYDGQVTDYYWRDQPPAQTYYVLDPRLNRETAKGSIYWVLSYDYLETLPGTEEWYESSYFDLLIVLKEKAPAGDVSASIATLARRLEQLESKNKMLEDQLFLPAIISPANGQLDSSLEELASEGKVYFPVGEEYVRTSQGLMAKGHTKQAWAEALNGLALQPVNIATHEWMATMLAEMGYPVESENESRVAAALRKFQQQRQTQTSGSR